MKHDQKTHEWEWTVDPSIMTPQNNGPPYSVIESASYYKLTIYSFSQSTSKIKVIATQDLLIVEEVSYSDISNSLKISQRTFAMPDKSSVKKIRAKYDDNILEVKIFKNQYIPDEP